MNKTDSWNAMKKISSNLRKRAKSDRDLLDVEGVPTTSVREEVKVTHDWALL